MWRREYVEEGICGGGNDSTPLVPTPDSSAGEPDLMGVS